MNLTQSGNTFCEIIYYPGTVLYLRVLLRLFCALEKADYVCCGNVLITAVDAMLQRALLLSYVALLTRFLLVNSDLQGMFFDFDIRVIIIVILLLLINLQGYE